VENAGRLDAGKNAHEISDRGWWKE
jgi:hypothetical protein